MQREDMREEKEEKREDMEIRKEEKGETIGERSV